MLLTCPSCQSRYEVAESALKNRGRKVRCTSCSHVWMAYPEDGVVETTGEVLESVAKAVRDAVGEFEGAEAPPSDEINEPAPSAITEPADDDLMFTDEIAIGSDTQTPSAEQAAEPGSSFDSEQGQDEPAADRQQTDLPDAFTVGSTDDQHHFNEEEDRRSRRKVQAIQDEERGRLARRRRFVTAGWALWLLFVLSVLMLLVYGKDQVTRIFPGMEALYETAHMVSHPEEQGIDEESPEHQVRFTEPKAPKLEIIVNAPSVEDVGGSRHIKISGKIRNTGPQSMKLVKLIGIYKDASGRSAGEWMFDPDGFILNRGATLQFASTHGPIPAGATDVAVDVLLSKNRRYTDIQAGANQ